MTTSAAAENTEDVGTDFGLGDFLKGGAGSTDPGSSEADSGGGKKEADAGASEADAAGDAGKADAGASAADGSGDKTDDKPTGGDAGGDAGKSNDDSGKETPPDQAALDGVRAELADLKSKYGQLESRYVETRDWGTKLNEELGGLREERRIEKAKAEGTYDEAAEATRRAEQVAADSNEAAMQAKVAASTKAAYKEFGKEYVDGLLFNDGAPFRRFDRDPAVQTRVLGAELPTLEAVQFMKELQFFEKYGRDMDSIKGKIADELRPELTEKIEREIKLKLKERLPASEAQVNGLAGSRGGSSEAPEGKETKSAVGASLSDIVGRNIA